MQQRPKRLNNPIVFEQLRKTDLIATIFKNQLAGGWKKVNIIFNTDSEGLSSARGAKIDRAFVVVWLAFFSSSHEFASFFPSRLMLKYYKTTPTD